MDITKVKAGVDREVANSKLFDIMVDMIGSDALLNTLAIRYPDQGHEAMEYIQSFWASSTNDHKAEKTYDDYEELQQSKLSIDTTVTQITEVFNKLSNMRAALEGTSRAITTTIHSHNMIGMIKRISTEHKHEVRASIEKADLEYPDKIANALEGVVSACCVPSVKPVAPVTNNINAMAAMQMANGPDEMAAVAVFLANMRAGNGGGGRTPRNWNHDVEKCNDCGVRHTGKCFAKMLADGVEPPGFSKKTEDQKARLQTRAKEIKDKGPYKDRPPN
jgi:hypothetical protein